MKHRLLNFLLLAAMFCVGQTAWAAGYTLTLKESTVTIKGYKVKQYYNFQTNTPEVLPTSGDLRYREGGIWGLHNFESGARSAKATIPVAVGDIIVLQVYNDASYPINLDVASRDEKLTAKTGYPAYKVTSASETVNFTSPRYGGVVACLVLEDANKTTVGALDNTDGFEGAWSDDYKISPNGSLHLEFTNFGSKANVWNNWLLFMASSGHEAAISSNDFYFTLRTDNWAWTPTANSGDTSWYTTMTLDNPDAVDLAADLDGANVVMDIARSGKTVSIKAVMTTTAAKTLTKTFVIDCGDGSQDLFAALTIDGSHIVINNSATTASTVNADIDFSNAITDGTISGSVNSMAFTGNFELGYSGSNTDVLRVGNGTGTVIIPEGQFATADNEVIISFDMYFGNLKEKKAGFFLYDKSGAKIGGLYHSFYSNITDENSFNLDLTKISKVGKRGVDNSAIAAASNKTTFEIHLNYQTKKMYVVQSTNDVVQQTTSSIKMTSGDPLKTFVVQSDYNNSDRRCWFDNLKIITNLLNVQPADYTVKFVDEYGNALTNSYSPIGGKTEILHEGELNVGDEAVANEDEMHLFDIGGTRYIYTMSDTISLSDIAEENIINVKFHKGLNYDWQVVGKYDDKKVFNIENGYSSLEGDTLEVVYKQMYVKDGIAYKAQPAKDGRMVYRFPIVQQETPSTVQVDTVYYTKVGAVEMVEELEKIVAPGLYTFANNQCSGGQAAYTGDDFVQVTTEVLTPGKYKMTVVTCDQVTAQKVASDEWFVFNAVPRGSVLPTEEILRLTPTTRPDKSTQLVYSVDYDIIIKTPAYLYMKGGKPGIGIDYIMVTRDGSLSAAKGYVSVPDSLTEDITELATISAEQFDINIAPSSFVEVDGKRYLQMENGTITIQCTTGKAVKDVKFVGLPEDYTWDYVTSDLGTIDSLHWTMPEGFDKVIFTFTKPSLIAGISVGGEMPAEEGIQVTEVIKNFTAKNRTTDNGNGTFTTAGNAGNQYALVLADLSDISMSSTATVNIKFESKIPNGSRWLVGIGDKSERSDNAKGSSKATYVTDGLLLRFGTSDGKSYRVNGGTSNGNAFDVTVAADLTFDMKSRTMSYKLINANTGEELFSGAGIEIGSSVPSVIEAYSWLGNTTIAFSDVTVTVKDVAKANGAKLSHTASSSCGADKDIYTSTVDAEKEHVNNDRFNSTWQGAAYADFSLSVPDGQEVLSATLKFMVIGENRNARPAAVYCVNAGEALDYALMAEGKAKVNLPGTKIADITFPKASSEMLTVDVTEAVQSIVATGQKYVIFKVTGNAGGGDIAGKDSDAAPELIVTTNEGAVQYSIKYVTQEGVELKEPVTNYNAPDTWVEASKEELDPIYKDENKFIYVSGNEPITLSTDATANVITLVYREAIVSNWKVRGSSPTGILGTLSVGTGFEEDIVNYTCPRYMTDKQGRLYENTSTQYSSSAKLTKATQNINISYDLVEPQIKDVVLLTEGENLEGAVKSINNSSSNATVGYVNEVAKVVELKAGLYNLFVAGYFGSEETGKLSISDGKQTIFSMSGTGKKDDKGTIIGTTLTESAEIELAEDATLYLLPGNIAAALDYLYIQQIEGTGIANVKAAYEQGAVYNLKGQKVADSLEGLQPGLYLVNGKKVTVK